MRKYIFFLSVILMGACQSSAVFEKYEEQPTKSGTGIISSNLQPTSRTVDNI